MVNSKPNQSFVLILLGNESDAEVMSHAVEVLTRLLIPTERALLQDHRDDLPAFIEECRGRGLQVVVFGTYYAYTDEAFPMPADILIPGFKVITGPKPTTNDQLALTLATTGFGPDGAKNAGLLAARVLAISDPELSARVEQFVL